MAQETDNDPLEINISPERVCYIVTKAREYDVKVAPLDDDPGSNPADSGEREILEDYADDPTAEELAEAIDDLNEDEVIDVIAMVWIGRGDFRADELGEARTLAGERHQRRAAAYLMGIPTLGDFLEEGLTLLGHSCEEYEINRL